MLTNILAGLYYEWSAYTRSPTPIMYDPMTLAWLLEPSLCPLTPMHISIDDAGNTKETPGAPNAQVCLHSEADAFLKFFVKKVTRADGPAAALHAGAAGAEDGNWMEAARLYRQIVAASPCRK
jgi:hypothetical protein